MNLQEAIKKIKELEEENLGLRLELIKIMKKCNELERLVRMHDNPHTPPSKKIIKVIEPPKQPKKRGAPNAHKGATRKISIPDRIIDLKPGEDKIKILNVHRKVVEDIQIIKTNTLYFFYECLDEDSGKRFTTVHEDLPKKGRFGPNILSLWTMLHYQGTIPFDRLSQISKNCFNINITPSGLHNVIYRTAGIFEPNFRRVRGRIIKSEYVRSDETKYSYNGKRYWLWNISTKKDTLVLIRNSRGSRVLKEVFGDFIDGILNSDCFSSYEKTKAREYQKCWAHVLRDAKDLAKHNDEGKELYKMLLDMHEHIKKIKEEKQENTPKVKRWVKWSKKKFNLWLDKNLESKAVHNLVLRLIKYEDHWFTCLKYPFVESTNNGSEREIRKNVISRKISGLHRSELGLHSREIMMTTLITKQKRKDNLFEFVSNEIRNYNSKLG